MTEAQWLACDDVRELFHHRGRTDFRRLRLFQCACCRQVWGLFGHGGQQAAVEVAERYADGGATKDEYMEVMPEWQEAWQVTWEAASGWAGGNEKQAALFRDIFNPFSASIEATVLTPTVANLAAVAYEERALPSGELDTARLGILADALEEAGCAGPELLGHLRAPGPHVRGCWAIDLILGKGA
jgi:hypothetical protein